MAEAIRVFISYSHDSAEHSRRVLELSDRLRADGVDCNIDQYEVSPAERWPKWMDRQIEAAKFVLVVCTETYLRRVMGEEKPGTGLGVRWESLLVYQDLYDAGGENTKYVPVVFGVGDLPFVPKPLKGATYEVLDREEGYQKLLKRLDGVAAAKRPPLGIRAARPEFFQAPANNFREASVVRNADFVGREKLLKELHEQLGEADVALVHALSGEGGVGKSQLANEYAHRHNGDYEGMWWLDASRAGIDVSTAKVAEVMGLGLPVTAKPEEIRAAVCRRASAGKHLVILDNVDEAGVVEQWRMDRPGRVLVTTRRRDLPTARVRELEVNVLERGEAIELLRKHRADLKGQNNEAALGEVAGYLGDHALAVALVGAYLKQRPNVSAGKVLERLKRAEVGDEESLFEGLDPKDIGAGYTLKVAQSLALHFGELSELETAVLRVAAVCHPDGIPVALFCKVLGKDEEEVEEALRGLASRSIVRYDPTVSVHRLMQSVVRGRMKAAMREVVGKVVAVLAEVFEGAIDPVNMVRQDPYAAHAEAVVGHAEKMGGVERAGELGNQVGVYLWNRARYEAALGVLRRAERIDRAAFGDNHPNVASLVNNIGKMLQEKGDLEGAMKCYREAERIDRAASGDNHPDVARFVNNIGSVLHEKGDLEGAMKCFREAERIDRAAFGDNHPEVATDVNNIGEVLRAKGDLEGAMKCYREAERIDRAALGDNHPNVAIFVNNIGVVLREKGDLEGAMKCLREAERIDRATFGDNHPEVATDVNNIGEVLFLKGDREGARAALVEAFRIWIGTVGGRARLTIDSANSLKKLGLDPIAMARQIAGEAAAEELREAMEGGPGGTDQR